MTFWPDRWCETAVIATPISTTATQGIGCLDEVGLAIEGGDARGWFLRGWASLSEGWSAYGELSIVLIHPNCSYEVTVSREQRDDVARAYQNIAFGHSGYRALVPMEPLLEGDHAICVRARAGGDECLLHTGRVLRVRDARPYIPELQTEQLLQVVHVPKSAGTSFQRLLQRTFGDALALHYAPRFVIGPRTRCIQGHCSAPNYRSFAPNIRKVMWFRDPVERVVSEYFHWRRHPETHPLDGVDLLHFARRREMVNIYRRALDGVRLSEIECVCITEHFQIGIELFRRMFGLTLEDGPPENINPNKEVGACYRLPDGVREQLALANLADLEIYEAAKQRFADLCKQHGLAVAGRQHESFACGCDGARQQDSEQSALI
jgi:hypothetical protein